MLFKNQRGSISSRASAKAVLASRNQQHVLYLQCVIDTQLLISLDETYQFITHQAFILLVNKYITVHFIYWLMIVEASTTDYTISLAEYVTWYVCGTG